MEEKKWNLFSLTKAFLHLAFACSLLCVSTFIFVASKLLTFMRLYLPCPCEGIFGFKSDTLCWHKKLVDSAEKLIKDVKESVLSRYPFDDIIKLVVDLWGKFLMVVLPEIMKALIPKLLEQLNPMKVLNGLDSLNPSKGLHAVKGGLDTLEQLNPAKGMEKLNPLTAVKGGLDTLEDLNPLDAVKDGLDQLNPVNAVKELKQLNPLNVVEDLNPLKAVSGGLEKLNPLNDPLNLAKGVALNPFHKNKKTEKPL